MKHSTPTTPAQTAAGKPVLITLAALAKSVPCSRHRVASAVACGDIHPAAFLDLEGRLQPLFAPGVSVVLFGVIHPRPVEPMISPVLATI